MRVILQKTKIKPEIQKYKLNFSQIKIHWKHVIRKESQKTKLKEEEEEGEEELSNNKMIY